MYTPSYFAETRLDALHGLIMQHPLGILVTHGASGLSADHIPFEIVAASDDAPFGVLRAHVARANPLWRSGGEVMVVFQGASAYVTPALYEEKAISGKVVPTWNYAVVQAHGKLRAIDDPVWLLALLERLTAKGEASRAAPWSVHDAPREHIDRLMQAIVGIEIVVTRLEGKFKLSQNRSEQDRAAIEADTGLMASLPPVSRVF